MDRVQEARDFIRKQQEELKQLTSHAAGYGSEMGFERLDRLVSRTAKFLEEKIHPDESRKFKEVQTDGDFYTDARNYYNFLLALDEELVSYPEYVLSKDDTVSIVNLPVETNIRKSKVFIGHGRSQVWRELKDFIQEKLKLEPDEFNRQPVAGIATTERLQQMLDDACFAFLIMTAEDEQPDGTWRARENVIHEAGLFQGRLGFKKAILLLEDGCGEFSNVSGLNQIRFPKGRIKAGFEEIREVLERERII